MNKAVIKNMKIFTKIGSSDGYTEKHDDEEGKKTWF